MFIIARRESDYTFNFYIFHYERPLDSKMLLHQISYVCADTPCTRTDKEI
jgi:hypothetical protein